VSRTKEAAAKLQSISDEILNEFRQLPKELIHWRPAADAWSAMDILCHIEEFVPYWTAQILAVTNRSAGEWGRTHVDPHRLTAVENTAARNVDEVEKHMRLSVQHSAGAIANLNDADLDIEAPSRNPRWGVKPAGFILDDLLLGHMSKHLGQIRRNAEQFREEQKPALSERAGRKV
jgi:uncharacterized damage-inducible protein DinB